MHLRKPKITLVFRFEPGLEMLGGIFWVGTMILGSYSLGHLIPNIAQRIHYVIAVVILLSILPVIVSLLRARGASAAPRAEEK